MTPYKKLQNLIENLRTTKSFPGSIPDMYYSKDYMTHEDVVNELERRYKQFISISSIKNCGKLTTGEREELKLLKEYFD